MNHMQVFFLIGTVGLIVGNDGALAQTREFVTGPLVEQTTAVERPTATAKVKMWTRARWEAARRHWAQDNARFYACSNKWREQTNGRKYSLHDQREFLFQCMSDGKLSGFQEPWTAARVKTWTSAHWEAARLRWAQDHGKFYECRNKLLEQSRHQRFSSHDGRERLFRCMNDLS
jgi:hypothetical protein